MVSLSSFIGVDGQNVTLNPAASSSTCARGRSGRRMRARSSGGSPPGSRRAGHRAVHAAGAGPHHRHGGERDATSYVSQTWSQDAGARLDGPRLADATSEADPPRRRGERPAGERARPPTSPSTATAGPLRHHPGFRRQRALRRLRPAHHLDDLHPVEPVPGDLWRPIGAAPDARFAAADLPAVLHRHQRPGAAHRHRPGERAPRAAPHQPSRPVPGHHDLVQPRARPPRSGRRWRRSRRRSGRWGCRTASG